MTDTADAPAPTTIVFGTDGWRARIADEYTFENVRRCADGVAHYVVERGETAKGVVVAFDRRFASEHFAAAAAEVLLAHGIPVALAVHAVPTQMSSYEVVERGRGGRHRHHRQPQPVGRQRLQGQGPDRRRGRRRHPRRRRAPPRRERRRRRSTAGRSPTPRRPASSSGSTRSRATSGSSAGRSTSTPCKAADVRVLVDPLWGAGAGWISRLLAGGRIDVHEIHQERNPYFGGVNPEPIRPNVDEALGMLAGGGYDLGLLLDGDADRAGAADERGTFIHQLQVTGLLMYYLAEHRGWRDPVVVSVNNTSMAARLGERYGIETHETPVGFKFIGPKMIETGAMMGAEESGGFGFGMHLPERDGVYADLLLLDLFLRERAAGPLAGLEAIAHFHEIAGPSFYLRIDVHVERAAYAETKRRLLVDLAAQAPTDAGRRAGRADGPARHRRRVQVLPRRRLVAAHPGVGDRAARPGLHGGDLGGAARRAAGRRRAPGARLMSDLAAGSRATRRQAVGPRAHLGPHGPLRRQDPRHRERASGSRSRGTRSRTSRSSSCPAASGSSLEDDDGDVVVEELGPGEHRRVRDRADPSLRGDRALRAHRGLDAGARRRRPPPGRLRTRRDQRARRRFGG